jgi:hypothetical protein
MALSDNLHDLEHLIADTVGNAFEGARRALADQIRRRSESGLREARERGFRELREATARLDGSRTQAEVLTALLEEGGRFASRTALFLTFADGARGWAAFGFADHAQGIDSLRLSYTQGGLDRLAAGRGAVALTSEESAELARHLGGEPPQAGVLVPLVLRDRVAAALYADQARGGDAFVPAALQLLAFTAAQLLETQGTRERAATPTLTLLEEVDRAAAGSGLPLWDPAAVEAAATAAAAAAPTPSAVPEAPPPAPAAAVAAPTPPPQPPPAPPPAPEPTWQEPVWESPAVETATEAAPAEPAVEERAEAPAPWEELPEEPAWAAPPEAPAPVEEPVPPAPAWQPSWQMEEAAPPAAAEAPSERTAEIAPEDAWVYTDQGYEAEAEETYEGPSVDDTAVEEVAAEAALDETSAVAMDEAGIDATAMEAGYEEGIEEVAAEPVEEGTAEEAAPWQAEAPPTPPESTTSPLYGAPLYPSEATVRISRDLLQSTAAQSVPPPSARAADISDDSTVMLARSAVAPAPPPAPPVEEPPGRAATAPRSAPVFGGGSTEVQPPPDLEGPGWAFRSGESTTASYRQQGEENSALHEEARRLARLLVSEIKLYNEEQIEEGRRQRDIYPRLQDDIDRSRQMYEERVDPKVRDEVDYFHQEMINILAGGDAGALGM